MATPRLKNRFLWLLLSLLALFIVMPFIVESRADLYVFGLLFTLILLASTYVIIRNHWLFLIAIILASLIFIGLWLNNLILENRIFLGIEYILLVLYFVIVTVVVLYSVMRDDVITFNTICGAVCGYLLIGMLWSLFFNLIYFSQSGAFSIRDIQQVVFNSSFQQFTYYSFVTLTTLGYGDITPLSNIARTFAWIEAVVGQVYLAVWISRLVGLHIAQQTRKQRE